jgi:medium-chain acyl-[acyl-carrier-protein] hydrolase
MLIKTNPSGAWVQKTRADPNVRLRLFCFPYAGGGAGAFRGWADMLSDEIDVCPVWLPGRESRSRELPYTRMSLLLRAMTHALTPLLDVPFAFFGHSMGALIAFEFAHHLRLHTGKIPLHLFVGGHRAPQLLGKDPLMHMLPDAAFIQRLRSYSGTPDTVLDHPDFVKIFLPMLRADFAICETYRYIEQHAVDWPISVFGGLQDNDVAKEELEAWRMQTQGRFNLRMLPGNHFFLHTAQPALLSALSEDLLGSSVKKVASVADLG